MSARPSLPLPGSQVPEEGGAACSLGDAGRFPFSPGAGRGPAPCPARRALLGGSPGAQSRLSGAAHRGAGSPFLADLPQTGAGGHRSRLCTTLLPPTPRSESNAPPPAPAPKESSPSYILPTKFSDVGHLLRRGKPSCRPDRPDGREVVPGQRAARPGTLRASRGAAGAEALHQPGEPGSAPAARRCLGYPRPGRADSNKSCPAISSPACTCGFRACGAGAGAGADLPRLTLSPARPAPRRPGSLARP